MKRSIFFVLLVVVIFIGSRCEPPEYDTTVSNQVLVFSGGSSATSSSITPDGGTIVAGSYRSIDNSRNYAYLAKFSADEELQWWKNYEGERGGYFYGVIATTGGDFLAVGYTNLLSSDSPAAWALLIDSTGEPKSSRTIDGNYRHRIPNLH